MLNLQDFLIALTVLLASCYAIFRYKRRELYKFAAEVPGPKGFPFVGILPKFFGVNSEGVYKTFESLGNEFSESFKMWFGPYLFYIVRDPDDLEIILKSEYSSEKHEIYDKISLPHGLFTINGDEYKLHRKCITPVFNLKSLQSFVPIISEQTKKFIANIKEKSKEDESDNDHDMAMFNLNNILATLFGIKDVPEKLIETYHNDNMKIAEVINERMMKYWLTFESIFKISNLYEIQKKHGCERENTLSDYLMEAQEEEYQAVNKNGTKSKAGMVVDLLYKIRNRLRYDEIKGEVDTILIAGYDSIAIMLSNVLLMLAIHQEVQAGVVAELKEIFGNVDAEVTDASLGKMNYLEMVIKECLRLFPLPVFSVRTVTKDLQLTKRLVPSGTSILYQPLFFQTSEQIWGSDAKQFKPERFLPENICNIHPYGFIPFSQGPRRCIGQKYSWIVMKVFIAHVLRNFHLTSSIKYEEVYLEMEFLLRIKPGYYVKFETRTDF